MIRRLRDQTKKQFCCRRYNAKVITCLIFFIAVFRKRKNNTNSTELRSYQFNAGRAAVTIKYSEILLRATLSFAEKEQ